MHMEQQGKVIKRAEEIIKCHQEIVGTLNADNLYTQARAAYLYSIVRFKSLEAKRKQHMARALLFKANDHKSYILDMSPFMNSKIKLIRDNPDSIGAEFASKEMEFLINSADKKLQFYYECIEQARMSINEANNNSPVTKFLDHLGALLFDTFSFQEAPNIHINVANKPLKTD